MLYDNYLSTSTDSQDISNAKTGLIKSLRNKGLTFLHSCVLSKYDEDNNFSESKYLNSCKLGIWEDFNFENESKAVLDFNESVNNLFNPDNQKNNFIIDMAFSNTQKCMESILHDLSLDNLLEKKIQHSIIKLYNLEEIKKYLIILKNHQNNEYLELALFNLFQHENFETKYFMRNTDSFSLFDNLLKLRLKSTQLFLKKNFQHLKIDKFEENLFDNLIDNSIYFKKFEVI